MAAGAPRRRRCGVLRSLPPRRRAAHTAPLLPAPPRPRSASCEGSPWQGDAAGEWRTNPHVQSYVLATDKVRQRRCGGGGAGLRRACSCGVARLRHLLQLTSSPRGCVPPTPLRPAPLQVGLDVWLADQNVFACWSSMWDVIWHGELGSSLALLNAGAGGRRRRVRAQLSGVLSPVPHARAPSPIPPSPSPHTPGYGLDCFMLRYQGVDWRDKANWACNKRWVQLPSLCGGGPWDGALGPRSGVVWVWPPLPPLTSRKPPRPCPLPQRQPVWRALPGRHQPEPV